MNRFFRTAYATTLVYLFLILFGTLITGVIMPFPAFSCLYFGLLLCLLPGVSPGLTGKGRLFYVIGAMTAALGFLPLALWRCPIFCWIIHLAGIAAAAVFLSILRHRTTHGIFMSKFEFTVALVLILIVLVYLAMLTGVYQDGEASGRSEILSLAISSVVPYAIVLLASGVLLLRGLRAQPGLDEPAFNRRQLRDTLIFAVLVTLVFVVDPFVYIKKGIFFLLTDVLRPSARYLVQLLAALLKLISRRERPAEEVLLPPEEVTDPKPMPEVEPAETEPEHYFIEENDLSLAIAYFFIAAAVLVLLYFLALQIRKLVQNLQERSRSRGSGYPNETREALPAEDGKSRKRKPKRRRGDPRGQIRYLYGEFLRHLHKLRVRVGQTNTCGEIQQRAEYHLAADPSTLSDLTAKYEEARYRLKEKPTEVDVHIMKGLLDRVKKGRE